ncbi:major facilitator superfamily domain-containing protein [Kockovaella imperatae]|uniref:Major facilitator superfamily domain-containing protein n=1 Tax=Kockovaella imperatae TaxID=4999 RepID=A0A1Y1U6Z5_9TREE|nr:major facilitator superfamily domain-containing protein [Kockovaella imperatae]ORX33800.1 major facilitator superfamily domain-containing protein [Kockovaella imperatae]
MAMMETGRVVGKPKKRSPPSEKRMKWMLATMAMMMILEGWNDGSLGPVIPALQDYYHVDYMHISMIFILTFCGCFIAGFGNIWLDDALGFGYTATFGSACQGMSYIVNVWGPPFPIFVAAFIFTGFGFALQDAQCNALCSRLPNASTKLSLLHACFGLGAFIAPFFATAFVQAYRQKVYLYFWMPFGVAAITVTLLVLVFQGRSVDDVVESESSEKAMDDEAAVPLVESGKDVLREEEEKKEVISGTDKLRRLFSDSAIMYILLFIIVYVGYEVAIGGWAVTFLIDARGASLDSGYVSAGYYGGIAAGRAILIPVTNALGHRRAIFVYLIAAILLEVCIMLAPSIFIDAVAFSLVGVVIGPIYPAAIVVITEIIPLNLQSGTIGLMGALGGAGSAMMPFIVGALSDFLGIWVLQPVCILLMIGDLILWILIARKEKIAPSIR